MKFANVVLNISFLVSIVGVQVAHASEVQISSVKVTSGSFCTVSNEKFGIINVDPSTHFGNFAEGFSSGLFYRIKLSQGQDRTSIGLYLVTRMTPGYGAQMVFPLQESAKNQIKVAMIVGYQQGPFPKPVWMECDLSLENQ